MFQTKWQPTVFRATAFAVFALVLNACSDVDSSSSTSSSSTTSSAIVFAASSYSSTQSGKSITLSVARSGAATDSASVAYATVNGSATAGVDYSATTGTLVWAENDTTARTITVPLMSTTPFTGDKTFSVELSNPSPASSIGTPGAAAVTISGMAVPTVGSLQLADKTYTLAQSAGALTVTVQRSGGDSGAVSVAYATANGTAVAGTNFTASNGTLDWADGDSTAKTFKIPVAATPTFSGSKSFSVNLSGVSGGAALGSQASSVVTVTGDGVAAVGSVELATASYSVAQNAGTVTVTVARTNGSSGAISVAYATANGTAIGGTDFTAGSGTLNWANGDEASKTFSVAISNAKPFTGNKAFSVVLSKPSSGAAISNPGTGTITISGDAAPAVGSLVLSAPKYTVPQNAGTSVVTVNRMDGSSTAVSVAYMTVNGTAVAGTDYTASSGTLQWANGDTAAKSFAVPISNAKPFSGSKSFTVKLANPAADSSLASPNTAPVVINGDATAAAGDPQLSAATFAVVQNAGSATITVNRSGGSSGAISVAYATTNGTAVAGSNFTATSGTLQWAAGDATSKTFTVPVSNATPFSGTKNLTVTLSNPSGTTLGTPTSATLTITGDATTVAATPGSVELSAATYAATQTGGTATITVERSSGTSATSVAYATANGSAVAGTDFTATSGTLQWAAGDTAAQTIVVPVGTAYPFAGSKSFTIALSNPADGASLGSPANATVTITGDAAAAVGTLQLSASSDAVAQAAGSVTITVARSGGTNGEVSVAYATANGTATSGSNYTATSGTLSWANGDATSKTFSVPVSDATPFVGSKTFAVTLSNPSAATLGSPTSATVTITGSSAGSSGSGGPSAVTNFTLVEQGGPNNASAPLTNYQALSWTAATPGSNPISHYQIYRNGVAYATTTATSYADSNAPNSNDPTWATPAKVYAYQVAAVDTAGNVGPQAAQLASWMYHDGVRYSDQDLSYGSVKTNYLSTAGNPQNSTYDVSVFFNNGGFLPVVTAPEAPVDDLEVGALGYMTIDINPGSSVAFNGTPRIGLLSRLPPGDVGPWKGANLFDYGPTPVANTWATYKIPLADLGMGFCTFTGSIKGTTMTVTSVQSGCVGIDGGGHVTGPNVPAGTYILGWSQQASVGTFTLGGPNVNGSTSVASETMTYQRTAIYKFNIVIPNESPTMYINNIGWTLN